MLLAAFACCHDGADDLMPKRALHTTTDLMPALQEEVDVEYKSTHPGRMHACGHDTHMAMMLGGDHRSAV